MCEMKQLESKKKLMINALEGVEKQVFQRQI